MVRNYFKTAWRTLVRNRSYTVINLTGLTLGLGIAIVLFWIVRFEYSFDRYHNHAARLYRLINNDQYGEKGSHVPQGVIKALNEQVPGVEQAVNVYGMESDGVKVDQTVFNIKHLFFVPASFMSMIDVQWLSGSARQSLGRPYQVVLDEPTARRFFGDGNPLGKTIRIRDTVDLTVAGIIRKLPANTEFQFQVLVSYPTLALLQPEYKNEDYWGGGDSMYHGYALLQNHASVTAVETQLAQLCQKHKNQRNYTRFELLPLVDVHRDTQSDADSFNYVIPQWMLYTLAGIGLFLILIASINFINLATVQATQRSREIGIRKVLGSSQVQLITQFFGETALLVFSAIILGSILATQLIQYADQLLNTQAAYATLWDTGTFVFLAILAAIVIFLAGSYPALVLARFQPIQVLKNNLLPAQGGVSLRKVLVVVQFVIAQGLVICTLIGVKQIRYFNQKDLGFDRQHIVTVRMPDRGNAVLRERFRQQLLQHPEVQEVAFGLTTPSSNRNWWWSQVWHRNLPNGEYTFRFQYIDTNYFQFFRIPLVAGRLWTRADTNTVVVLNEKAVRDLGFQTPEQAVGEHINLNYDQPFTVIGVVKDYHSQSLKSSIVPHVFLYADWNFQTACIRIDPRNSLQAIEHIQMHWSALFPNHYFEATFLDDDLRVFYEDERKLANFLTLFAIIAIFIGCLGLFGLVSFVVTQRTREIGIRKILGASVGHIVSLLSKDFLKLVLLAAFIAVPVAWYAMNQWLQAFEYRIPVTWWIFGIACFGALAIALVTISFQTVRAARANPVKSLRTE